MFGLAVLPFAPEPSEPVELMLVKEIRPRMAPELRVNPPSKALLFPLSVRSESTVPPSSYESVRRVNDGLVPATSEIAPENVNSPAPPPELVFSVPPFAPIVMGSRMVADLVDDCGACRRLMRT